MQYQDITILVDMDGVLVDMSEEMLSELNEEFGTDYTPSDLEAFDYSEYMPQAHADYMYDLWHKKDRYAEVDPVPGAMEGVERLRELGRVVVASSPMKGHAISKIAWLERHGFNKSHRVLISDKNLLRGGILIDDGFHNIRRFHGQGILVDQPYNRKFEYLIRAFSWSDIVRYVENMIRSGIATQDTKSRQKAV